MCDPDLGILFGFGAIDAALAGHGGEVYLAETEKEGSTGSGKEIVGISMWSAPGYHAQDTLSPLMEL